MIKSFNDMLINYIVSLEQLGPDPLKARNTQKKRK